MARDTLLERIIEEQAGRTFIGNVSAWVDRSADEFARELFADDEFRKNIHELARAYSRAILVRLMRERKTTPRRGSSRTSQPSRRAKKRSSAARARRPRTPVRPQSISVARGKSRRAFAVIGRS